MTTKSSLVLIGLILLPTLAMAHAHLVKSTPNANEQVKTPLQSISLQFSENVEPTLSKIEVISQNTGARIELEKAHLIEGKKNAIQAVLEKPILPGHYTVRWKVTSVDTHKSHGDFSFDYIGK